MSDRERDLLDAADTAANRIALERWTHALDRSAVPVFVGVGALLLALRYQGHGIPTVAAIVLGVMLIGAWALATFAWAFTQRPNAVRALARWDERAGRNELFTSALNIVQEGANGPAIERLLEHAEAKLPDARERMRRELPYYVSNPAWLAPALFLTLLCSGILEAPPVIAGPGDGLSEEEQARASKAGDALDKRAQELDAQHLTEEERARLEALREKLKETAASLKDKNKKSARKVLEKLEKRAREAERLALKLGEEQREKVSKGMLAELERHADTAELAGSLRGGKFDKAADETKRLGNKLTSPELSIEARQRIQEAFHKGLQAATTQDKMTRLAKRLGKAHALLAEKKPQAAGLEILELSKYYRKIAERLKAKKALKQLAKRLRELGQEALGKKQKAIKALAAAPRSGLDPSELRRLMPDAEFEETELPFDELLPPAYEEDPFQDLVPLEEPPPPPGQMPVPGEGDEGGQGGGQAPVPGDENKPGRGGGGGWKGDATKTLDPTDTSVVRGRKGRGASAIRQRKGRGHAEGASEEAKSIATEFLKTEEAAIADEPLPASRRRQVERYFKAIRKHLGPKAAPESE